MTDSLKKFEETENRLFAHYGAELRPRYVELREPRMRVRILEAGLPDDPPVVLVHGGGSCASTWAPLMPQLRGLRVYAVDRPGCGLSGRFLYDGVALRAHAVAFLDSVLDALELPQAAFVGNSMGGLWTLWLGLDRPARVSSIVQLGCPALVLDTSAPLLMRLMAVPGVGRILMGLAPPGIRGARSLLQQLGESEFARRAPDALLEHMVSARELPGSAESWGSLVARVVTLRGPRADVHLGEEELRRLEQRVAIVWGRSDPFGSVTSGRHLAEVLPRATFEVVDAGHIPWLAEPERIAETIRGFLAAPKQRAAG